MPKGYVIAHATVTDAEKWAQYVAKSKVALDKFEGRPIVRGGKCEIVEGENVADAAAKLAVRLREAKVL